MTDVHTMLREIATHMATTPPLALAPLLWGVAMLLLLRRLDRRTPPPREPAAPAESEPVTLRPAA